ncbi:uncharacterized protein ALTATR162_LOCUS2471 [Alternaria atra]|uniref:SET domain-containing protein n=1 Tax=Alternaria atra TaxID=119953 RepID=A0A8J2HX52_9PLEO|nr:uncharacterized protein ALTATR162_LOCUS2471 [Alternaria atra]CAG5149859.1 unnamed protein product [Alternaria atra]
MEGPRIVSPAGARARPGPTNTVLLQRWVPSIYRSGTDPTISQPHPDVVGRILQSLDSYNELIVRQPYDPNAWIGRGRRMMMLNFPELAVGDAYKAKILEARASGNDKDIRVEVYKLLEPALQACHCQWDAAEILDESAMDFGPQWHEDVGRKVAKLRELLKRKEEAAIPLGGTPYELRDRIRDGGVLTVEYPWTVVHHLTRAPGLVKLINEELEGSEKEPTCYLHRSTLSKDSEEDMLGIFAAREVRAGERILTDRTATGVCSTPTSNSCSNCYARLPDMAIKTECCSESYCSTACLDLAMNTYHKAICGKDFAWLQEPAKGLTHNASPLRPLLMLRILAACVQSGVEKSPLDHPLIARLKPVANKNHLDVFTLTESIIIPIKILEQLGVDVFANRNFDTEILHSIWTRLANNKAGSFDPRLGFVDEITPHLPLFNHSCDPNVEWRRENGSTTVRFFAIKPVKKGEELFCSYLNVEGMPVEHRQEMLWPWFEGPCLCSRCEEEERSLGI